MPRGILTILLSPASLELHERHFLLMFHELRQTFTNGQERHSRNQNWKWCSPDAALKVAALFPSHQLENK